MAKIMDVKPIKVKMDTAGNSGGFINAINDMGEGFNSIAKEIELIEDVVKEIGNMWKGDASAAFISNITQYIDELKGYCDKSEGTMYKLYTAGMVKAKKQYVKAEKAAIVKLEDVNF